MFDDQRPRTPETTHDDDARGFALVATEPRLPREVLERDDAHVVEVLVLWGSTVLAARHVAEGAIVLGDAAGSVLVLPESVLGAASHELARVSAAGVEIVAPPRATVTLEHDGERTSIEGGRTLVLAPGERATLALGAFEVRLSCVNAGRKAPPLTWLERWQRSGLIAIGAAGIAHAAFFGSLSLRVPGLADDDAAAARQQEIDAVKQYLVAMAEREREEKEDDAREHADEAGGHVGAQAKGVEGEAGSRDAPRRNARLGVKGPPDTRVAELPRQTALDEARNFETIGLVASLANGLHAPSADWGALDPVGRDAKSALGNLFGDTLDDAAGVGGLHLSGNDEGGGGKWNGIGFDTRDIGNGRLDVGGPGGFGTCTGPHCGLGKGREHATKAPQMRIGTTIVNGVLPPEVVQRIVRQSFGRFRACYEGGLRGNPQLAGRVVTRFVVSREGAVTQATEGGSDLPDANVVACVHRAFYGLSFPEHEGGIVSVVYPLMFTPE